MTRLSVLGASVAASLLGAAACSSELGGGSQGPTGVPVFTDDPFGNPGGGNPGGGNPGGGNPGDVNAGGGNPGGEGNPDLEREEDGDIVVNLDPSSVTAADGTPLPVDQLPPLDPCDTPGPRMIRRLTAEQYLNTLASVFGEQNVPDTNPLIDASAFGYNVDADTNIISGLDAQSLMSTAEGVAASARQNGFINQLTNGCNDRNNQDCTRQFVSRLGERIAREPFPEGRINDYAELFRARSQEGDELVTSFDEGAELVMTAMIQSPYLLYRRELGNQQGGAYQLTPFEVASSLAYFLTNEPPDDQLLQAARNNQLNNQQQIEQQADRLLGTDAARDVLRRFVLEWLDVDGLGTKVKDVQGQELSGGVREAMLQETEALFLDTFENGGTIADLLSATYTFINQELAGFYGINGVNGNGFQRVDLSGTNRIPGLLGHGAFLAEHALANNSSPVQRALIVRERLLCDPMGPVPSGLDTNLRPPDPNVTNRERYSLHSENDPCNGCHSLMDPIGFTFENYDAFGRFRDTEAGKPVDSSGGVPLVISGNLTTVPLEDAAGLANYLSESELVRACLANNLAYYAYGMENDEKWPSDQKACTDASVRQVARESGNTLRSVLLGILRAPHFTRRVQDR